MRRALALAGVALVLVACGGAKRSDAPPKTATASPADAGAGATSNAHASAEPLSAEDEAVREAMLRQCGEVAIQPTSEARELLVKACSLQDGEGCERLGGTYLCGFGVQPDMAVAFEFYDRACKLRRDQGCVISSVMLEHGLGVPKDEKRAFDLLDRSCKAQMMGACRTMAITLLEQDDAGNRGRAVELWTKACDGDLGEACDDLSRIYAAGWGPVTKDEAKAYTYASKGCRLGNANACGQTGSLLALGVGVAKDTKKGVELIVAACEKGSALSCENAATVFASGHGVPKDDTRALDYLQRACKMGLGRACRLAADLGSRGGSAPSLAPPVHHGHF